ncbi:MAG: M48 family metallopeptidase [Desulfobacterales bacterium]|nr:MAG: M48 family metallopeptidase [Desulfobacterales bacterium]
MKASKHEIHAWRSIGGLIAVICMLFQIQGCAEVPITHRKGLHLVPETELLSMSLQQYDEVLKKSKLSTDTRQVEMVRRTGNRIAKAAEAFLSETGQQDKIKNYKWEFNLIEDDKTVNAWVMPGGKAVVYTGILPYTQNEAGLAVVLGHEVAHALADHGNERMSEALLANMGGMALSVALSTRPQQTQQLFMTVYGVGANLGFLLPYSRLHESEADRIGLTLMARAGYDPREAIPFWQRMGKQEGKASPPEFLSTHPAPETRIADIKKYIPEALPYYDKTKK